MWRATTADVTLTPDLAGNGYGVAILGSDLLATGAAARFLMEMSHHEISKGFEAAVPWQLRTAAPRTPSNDIPTSDMAFCILL